MKVNRFQEISDEELKEGQTFLHNKNTTTMKVTRDEYSRIFDSNWRGEILRVQGRKA